MSKYIDQAKLSCGGELVEVWWCGADETFSLHCIDDLGMATGKVEYDIPPEKLKYYVILTEEIEEWAFDNDVFL